MEKKFVPLLPEHLNAGSKRSAVEWFVQWAHSERYLQAWQAVSLTIEEQFEKAVRNLQEKLGYEGDKVDGNLGPGTREDAQTKLGIRFDDIPMLPGQITFWRHPDDKPEDEFREWSLDAAA